MARRSDLMRSDIEFEFTKTMNTLKELWDDIGFSDDQITKRGGKVIAHVQLLYQQMVKEESKLKDSLQAKIEKQKPLITQLNVELSLPEYKYPNNLPLLQTDELLGKKCRELQAMKNKRMAEYASLKAVEEELCDQLYITPYYVEKGIVPSQKQLKDIKEHIETLQAEKNKRELQISSQKLEIMQLYDELGLTPQHFQSHASFSQEFIGDETLTCYLPPEKMEKVAGVLEDLHFRRIEVQLKVDTFRQKINVLWDRLETPECDRNVLFNLKQDNLQILQLTLQELERIKLENMKKFIEKVRCELVNLWDKCYYSKEQRSRFYAFEDESYTEELLLLHEGELSKMQAYYGKHKDLFCNFSKWNKNFEQMVELDKKSRMPDPNRYKNRGGGLLNEEKKREKLKKQLPKIEEDLFHAVKKWQNDMSEPFLIEGVGIESFIEDKWIEFDRQKQIEIEERKLKKQKDMEHEMTFGSKAKARTPLKFTTSNTPLKRPATGCKTPTTGRKKIKGNVFTPSRSTARANLTNRSPGRTPISFRVQPGDSIHVGKSSQVGKKVSKKLNMDKKQPESQSSTITSTKSAPTPSNQERLDFSATVVSEPHSRYCDVITGVYEDFAQDLNKNKKIPRSSSIHDVQKK